VAETIVLIGSPSKGEIRTLYSPDSIKILKTNRSTCRAKRVSHIEVDETQSGSFKGFYVDLKPVGGPKKSGFKDRASALAYEHAWLIKHKIPFPSAVKPVKKIKPKAR
jgi:hypothetical protein